MKIPALQERARRVRSASAPWLCSSIAAPNSINIYSKNNHAHAVHRLPWEVYDAGQPGHDEETCWNYIHQAWCHFMRIQTYVTLPLCVKVETHCGTPQGAVRVIRFTCRFLNVIFPNIVLVTLTDWSPNETTCKILTKREKKGVIRCVFGHIGMGHDTKLSLD